MATQHSPSRTLLAAASLLCCGQALAQTLPTVSVSGRSADAPVAIGGFGDTPIAKLPLQAGVLSAERLQDAGASALSALTALDASIGDAYNAQGYVSYLKVRGFDLDSRFNYRRDGLPINAETALALGNKSAIEVLKGSSGMQAGTSAPGGLVNLIVKRPDRELSTLSLGLSEAGTTEAALDLSRRFGAGQVFGLRLNAAASELRPLLRDAQGQRRMLALAGDWRASADTKFEAEFEWSRQSQPSQPGFSLLGNALPDARQTDPRINLNNQDWTLPVVFEQRAASLRVQQRLSADWRAQAHLGLQRLRTDDRAAFPFGCSDADGSYWDHGYCPNGDFDMWDYRSENERRATDALDLSLAGRLQAAGLHHELTAGVLLSRFQARLQRQAYNWAGTGNVSGLPVTTPDPTLSDENTDRDERSTELYLRDSIRLSADWQAWLGLRHSRLERDSVRTDGSRATHYTQSFTTPWLGLSHALSTQHMVYASWGEGVESEVAPNRSRYLNAGQALPALKSRQFELGFKSGSSTVDWGVSLFDIRRPAWRDIGSCDVTGSCVRQADGAARHRGIEAQADYKWSGGGLLASAMRLQARREGSADASLNGLRPVNVPESSWRLQLRQTLLPGLQASAGLVHEGERAVLPDSSLSIPAWTRIDAGLRYQQQVGGQLWTWRAGVDNLADRRAWREAPFQFGHAYLYPLAPRTWRAGLEISL